VGPWRQLARGGDRVQGSDWAGPNGVIQIFNVGAERMLGYAAVVVDQITPADISDMK
jgi:hypothetical protein